MGRSVNPCAQGRSRGEERSGRETEGQGERKLLSRGQAEAAESAHRFTILPPVIHFCL